MPKNEREIEKRIIVKFIEDKDFFNAYQPVISPKMFVKAEMKDIMDIAFQNKENFTYGVLDYRITDEDTKAFYYELIDEKEKIKEQLNEDREFFENEIIEYFIERATKQATMDYVDCIDKDDLSEETRNHIYSDVEKIRGISHKREEFVMSLRDICLKEYEEQQWLVPDLIPYGFTFLVGKPKIGKSFLALNLALSCSIGGKVLGMTEQVEQVNVLYLALEDRFKRIKERTSIFPIEPPENCYIAKRWKRINNNGLNELKGFIKEKDIKLVMIDTFAKIRSNGKKGGNRNIYDLDYEDVSPLKELADELKIAMIVIHHTRKEASNDILEIVSGSTGLTGAADTTIVLTRGRGNSDGELYITGRDVEEQELALKFDKGVWEILGNADEYRYGQLQTKIIEALKENAEMSVKEISELLDEKYDNVKKNVQRLAEKSIIMKVSRGKYAYQSVKE